MSLPLEGQVEKTVHEVETYSLVRNSSVVSKEGHTIMILRHEKTHHY